MSEMDEKKEIVEQIKELLSKQAGLAEINSMIVYASNGKEAFEWITGNSFETMGFMEDVKNRILIDNRRKKDERNINANGNTCACNDRGSDIGRHGRDFCQHARSRDAKTQEAEL
jgi:hypothetical protein